LAIEQLQLQGRSQLIKQIRQHLSNRFESVVLPRKWLFIQALPYTAQGKINQQLLTELLSLDSNRFPQIVQCDFQDNHVELQLKVLAKIVYFTGHFPEQPILPGVTQIAWAEQFGKLFFAIKQPFLRMEVIKFKKIIRPGDSISMTLNWKAESSKLYFEINSETDSHSSGRMVYGAQ
ncbi:MAG: AMP-dependent synthetase, partial [Methylococcales bacterium]